MLKLLSLVDCNLFFGQAQKLQLQGHSCLWLLDGKLCHLSALTPFRSNLFMYVSYSLVRTIYVHRLDIHTCSLEGGEGNICSPPLFTSPPSPPLLSCGCGCSCSVCRAQSTPLRSRRPLSPSVAIRNANASHLTPSLACRGRLGPPM